jgi:GNAT superfamily N-acetyltransferase
VSHAFRVRPADACDAGVLAAHRVAMLADMGQLARDTPLAAEVGEASHAMIAAALADGSWLAWLAEDGEGVVGGGAAILRATPPSARAPRGGGAAYMLNVYTEPRARRRGVATAIVRTCLETCRARGVVRVNLHASDAGRSVYERLGFTARHSEMELYAP